MVENPILRTEISQFNRFKGKIRVIIFDSSNFVLFRLDIWLNATKNAKVY